ncbi:MAG: acetyltransferase [Bacillota bacterium]
MLKAMKQKLIILGTSGNAYDVLDIVEAINIREPTWNVVGFLDDGRSAGTHYLGMSILGGLGDAPRFADCRFINAIGSDSSYRRRGEILDSTNLPIDRFTTLIHPLASVSPRAQIGRGVYVNFGASIGGGVTIGDQVAIGPGCIIGHDCRIDDLAIVAPGAVISGFVHIGRNCYIGAGAAIRQRIAIGEQSLVGMGAVVIRDVPMQTTVVGNPARPLTDSQTSKSPAL